MFYFSTDENIKGCKDGTPPALTGEHAEITCRGSSASATLHMHTGTVYILNGYSSLTLSASSIVSFTQDI